MIKQLESHYDLVAKDAQTKFLGDMIPYEGCSIQVIWSGCAGATGFKSVLLVQQSNDGATWDDISALTENVTTESGSVTFEHNQFEAAFVALKVTPGATALSAGTLHIHTVRRSAT